MSGYQGIRLLNQLKTVHPKTACRIAIRDFFGFLNIQQPTTLCVVEDWTFSPLDRFSA